MTLPSAKDGDNTNTLVEDFNAEDAFIKRFLPTDETDATKPSDKGKDEEDDSAPTEEEDAGDGSDESPEADDESDENGEDGKQRKYADDGDDTYVKIKVEDVEHEVSVKDLKRLWGQEKALTQKSQAVAEQRKAVEAEQQRYVVSTKALLERAQARFEPYAKVDFLLAAKELSPEEYTALRDEAEKAYADVKFLEAELGGVMQSIANEQRTALVEQARKTVQAVSDPETGIEGWSEKLYDDIRAYAITQGVPQDVVNTLVDESAIRILHKAMQYDRGKSKVKTMKVNKTTKKVVKTTTNPEETRRITKGAGQTKAMERLRKENSTDAATDAFLARWASDED